MACCVIAAYFINKIISACEKFHIGLDIQYNDANLGLIYGDGQSDSSSNEEITSISLSGLTCAACVSAVNAALTAVSGVETVRCSLQLQKATVIHAKSVRAADLKEAVEQLGYGAELGQRSPEAAIRMLQRAEELSMLRESFRTSVLLSCLLLLLNESTLYGVIGWSWWPHSSWVSIIASIIISTVVQWRCGSFIYINAWTAAKRSRVNMDSLIVLSNISGTLLSVMNIVLEGSNVKVTYFQTCSALTMVVIGGRYLDCLTRRKAGESLLELFSRRSETAFVKDSQGKRRVPASVLRPSDEIVIEPYSIIPCDCYVLKGISQVNESVISGESIPVSKAPGSLLLSGTRNGISSLSAVVYRDQENSTLSLMIREVSDATETEGSSPGITKHIMQWFVSGVICIAIASSLVSFYFLEESLPWHVKLDLIGKQTMAVLTSACPCAIGLSVPSAIMAGNDVARWCGILNIGGADVMSNLKDITYIVMDKTGTLTEGILKVVRHDITEEWMKDWSRFCLLLCAAEEPGAAVHPAGRAIFERYFAEISTQWSEYKKSGKIADLHEVPGEGIHGKFILGDTSSYEICLGNEMMMHKYGISWDETAFQERRGYLVVHIAINGKYVGRILLQDTVRPNVRPTIDRLKARNVEMMILTGDTFEEAQRVSKQLNIPIFTAQVSPSAKLDMIKKLQHEGHRVAVVGDGMNDAPSLAAADVGIMVCKNKQTSTLGGHVLILSPNFSALAMLFDIADYTMQQVQSNLFWSFAYNITAISLALGLGHPLGIRITPALGAALMSLSSASIAVRSLVMKKRLFVKATREDGLGNTGTVKSVW